MKKSNFWKSYGFLILMLTGIVAGCVVGAIWPAVMEVVDGETIIVDKGATVLEPLGTVFLNLMFCIAVPTVFCSISSSIANMQSARRAGKIMGVTIATFLVTAAFAAVIMYVTVRLIPPVVGAKILKQTPVVCRIVDIHAAGKHSHRRCSGGYGPAQCHGVNSGSAAGYNNCAVAAKLIAEALRLKKPIRGGLARADHGDDRFRIKIRENALIIQYQRRIVKIFEPVRISGVLKRQNMDVLPVALLQDLPRRRKLLIGKRSAPLRAQRLRVILLCCAVDRLGRSELL